MLLRFSCLPVFYLLIIIFVGCDNNQINGKMYSEGTSVYKNPSKETMSLVNFESSPHCLLCPDESRICLLYRNSYPTIKEKCGKRISIAGLSVEATNCSKMNVYYNKIEIKEIYSSNEITLRGLPDNLKLCFPQFSPDNSMLAFLNITENGASICVVNLNDGNTTTLTPEEDVNYNLDTPYKWANNSKQILYKSFSEGNKSTFKTDDVIIPTGPLVLNTNKGEETTIASNLRGIRNEVEGKNFEKLITSELFYIDIEKRTKNLFLKGDMYRYMNFSPDNNFLLLTIIQLPFSSIVPYTSFSFRVVVYNQDGCIIKNIANIPALEKLASGPMATRSGLRECQWVPELPSTLLYFKTLDNGDPSKNVEYRDEVALWKAPFDNQPSSIFKTIHRINSIWWLNDQTILFYTKWDDNKKIKEDKYFLFNIKRDKNPRLVYSWNPQDLYANPGDPVKKFNQYGKEILEMYNNKITFIGCGYSEQGKKPFIRNLNIDTLKYEEVYKSDVDDEQQEEILAVLDHKSGDILVTIESIEEPKNICLKHINSGLLKSISKLKNPFKEGINISKEIFQCSRTDGITLSGVIYYPIDCEKNEEKKTPCLIWTYPVEYIDEKTASQNKLGRKSNEFILPNPNTFTCLVNQGYAVLEIPSFPIVGKNGEYPNDSYLDQAKSNIIALRESLPEWIDKNRLCLGGSSYGGNLVLNILANFPGLVCCGISKSACYNRTLTPNKFQNESRKMWEAPALYLELSPIFKVQEIKDPVLIIHGQCDGNPATPHQQGMEMFSALKSLGKNATFVSLPNEGHTFTIQESIMHVLYEEEIFLDKNLKNKVFSEQKMIGLSDNSEDYYKTEEYMRTLF